MGRAYTRAYELCQTVDDMQQRGLVLQGLYAFRVNRAELHGALEMAQELLRLGETQEDLAVELLGYRDMGNVQAFLARFDAALPNLEEVILHYDPLSTASQLTSRLIHG
jgi:hypothetical protein